MLEPSQTTTDAYETYGFRGQGPLLLTCEHASNRVPAPLRTDAADQDWLHTHWGYDIGARTVTRELVRHTSSYGVMARFSRLVCDANRPTSHHDFIKTETEGQRIGFNRDLDEAEKNRRIQRYFDPYHLAVDDALRARTRALGDLLFLSIHSFTPVWSGRVRTMDIGVLYNPFEAVAQRLARELEKEGFVTALNEPYSAKDGLAYAVERHGRAHDKVYLELEFNQSLIATPARARRVARKVGAALLRLHLRAASRPDLHR